MNHKQYYEYSNSHHVKENPWKKVLIAFIFGGFLSIVGQALFELLLLYFSKIIRLYLSLYLLSLRQLC